MIPERRLPSKQMNFLHADLLDQLNPRHSLLKLAGSIPWEYFEAAFAPLYSPQGRPAKPIRLMVGLSILKHLENLSDEVLIQRWVRDPYQQSFCGETDFQWEPPCDPSEMTYFRNRIGAGGFEKILSASIALHGESAIEEEMCVDTTVQEKNITFPTDAKQYRKIHGYLLKLARAEGIKLARTHEQEVKRLKQRTRFAGHPRNRKKARYAVKRLQTIAGRLLREIQRQMGVEQQQKYHKRLDLYRRMLNQKRGDKNKIYSLHESHIYCMSKGKEHKRYEFGTKAAVAKTRDSNLLIGALAFEKNCYDGHTLVEVFSQIERILGQVPKICLGDRGYRGKTRIGEQRIIIPGPPGKGTSKATQAKMRKRFQRRAAIEPVIGHLKSDHRLDRNFLKGFNGDQINLLMAAAAFNFKKWMRKVNFWLQNIGQIFSWMLNPAVQE